MLGFWEVIIVLSILGWGLYSYLGKSAQKRLSQNRRASPRDEDLIDLDESNYEILDDEGDE